MAIGKETDAALTSNSGQFLPFRDEGMDDRSYPIAEGGAVMAAKRPLSPHLGSYRLPLTAKLSISHRVSGVFLVVGMLVLVVCLMAGAAGPAHYDKIRLFLNGVLGQTFIWAWLYALFFHLCHGVRHLVWDTGNGFSREHQDIAAYLEIAGSVLFSLMLFLATRFLWS